MKNRLPPDFLKKLKESVNLVEIVGEHVVLRKTGANFVGLCPFHSERSPSFSVSENKQLYHCYGCKKGGDLLSFVMEIHGLGFMEAIEELSERAKMPLPKGFGDEDGNGNEDPEAKKRREAYREKQTLAYKLNRFTAAFYHQNLNRLPEISRYFTKRGLGPDWIRNFYLGASQSGWDGLAQHILEKKAPLDLALELGLIRPSKKDAQGKTPGIGYYDLFRNRAMFPILDLRGRVAGFGGRILPSEDSESGEKSKDDGPKYLNSAESFIFQKSKLAYGLFQAQKHIREADEVVLVEGYFDVLALHAAGFQNAVAICGTSLTADHLQIFTRFGKKVTLLLDSDAAGLAATERAMELGLEKGMVLYGAQVPEGLDPDEILFNQKTGAPISGGVEKMKAILGSAAPLLDQKIEIELAEALKSPEARVQALKKLGTWLSRFRDPVGKEVRIDQIQKRLGVSRNLLSQAFGQNLGPDQAAPQGYGGGGGGFQRPTGPSGPIPGRGRGIQPLGGNRGGGRPAVKAQANLSKRDILLLTAVVRGKEGAQIIAEHRKQWPQILSISDLFDYIPVRSFMETLFKEPGAFELFRADPKTILETGFGGQEGQLDSQVRSTITEALISPDAPFEPEEIKIALDRAVGRALERISQRLHTAIADAEAKKDAGLEAQLKKEYLDVQRKLKEFNTFYDEA